ncbi:hypothetical protein JS562_52930 [Agrobacterium sp. S2]|nr:hypothetical protein [Agrobacterium sp. S2]
MKKIAFAMTVIVLSTGAALAENPFVGQPETMAEQDKAFLSSRQEISTLQPKLDFTSTRTVNSIKPLTEDGSSHRFGDASPSSYEN